MEGGSGGEGRDIVLAYLSPRSRQDRPPACHIGLADGKSYCPPLGRTEDIANQIAQSDKNTIRLPMPLALPAEDWAPPLKTGRQIKS